MILLACHTNYNHCMSMYLCSVHQMNILKILIKQFTTIVHIKSAALDIPILSPSHTAMERDTTGTPNALKKGRRCKINHFLAILTSKIPKNT